MEINNNFSAYIELNDQNESVICCDNLAGIKCYFSEKCIGIRYQYDNKEIMYNYDNPDILIQDAYRIKATVEGMAFYYIKKDDIFKYKEEE